MAESQVDYHYDAGTLAELRRTISAPRFDPYMALAANDERHAVGLYLYNARLAKAFLFPLQMAEVALRNAVVEALVGSYGPDWPRDPKFRAWLLDGGHKAIAKADGRLVAEKGADYPVSQLVATLTFDFWSNMLRDEYERPFWQTHFRKVLPHVPTGTLRRQIQRTVKKVCHFRNRVVHHEPILSVNAPAVLDDIIEIIGLRCRVTAEWTRHYCTVGSVVGTKPAGPKSAAGRTVGKVCDETIVTIGPDADLSSAISKLRGSVPVLIVVDASGTTIGAIRHADVLAHLATVAATAEGLLLLTEHTVGDVMAKHAGNWVALDAGDHLSSLASAFKRRGVTTVVVTEVTATATILKGVVLKAHRKY